jgi:Arc/MetJ family transcription regulator
MSTKEETQKLIQDLTPPEHMCMILIIHTHKWREASMRTNIIIDDQLMSEALLVSGMKTKKQAVEEGLKLLISMKKQEKIRELRGKLQWEGNLDQMRKDV